MKRIVLIALAPLSVAAILYLLLRQRSKPGVFPQPVEAVLQLDSSQLGISTIASGLNVPWEIAWGPDNQIWFTEQSGTVSKVNPHTGERRRLLTIPEVYRHRSLGLLGMAIYPDKSQPYVFLDYTHQKKDSTIVSRLVRYTYTTDTLKDPLLLMELPGNTGHNGSRVAISADGKVLLATGDAARYPNAPDTASPNGKVLRFNTDGSVPADNPYPGNYLWSRGHRNIQGLVCTSGGKIIASEHGDATDDELNLINKAAYYGWPHIEGYADRPAEKAHADSFPFTAPVKAWTPTIAPAGIDYYASGKIPEWRNCILLGTLKAASLYVLRLNATQDAVTGEQVFLSGRYGRLRDVCISPEGDVYIATSNRDWNPGKGFPLAQDDRILRLAKMMPGQTPPAGIPRLTAQAPGTTPAHNGAVIYKNYCEACHKPDGSGVPGSFPALNNSQLVNGAASPLIQLVLHGRSGNGKSRNSANGEQMPAFHFLSDHDLADVLSYIRSSWNNRASAVSAAAVGRERHPQ